jgi:hypothetical protein
MFNTERSEIMNSEEYYGVPKRDLILAYSCCCNAGVLRIAAGLEHGPDLAKEMAAMQVKITLTGHEQYAVWREGTHDDLVFAVALACWNAQNMYPNDQRAGSSGGRTSTRRMRPGYFGGEGCNGLLGQRFGTSAQQVLCFAGLPARKISEPALDRAGRSNSGWRIRCGGRGH